MNDLIQIAAVELARFLGANLPALSEAWWQQHVVDRLSFQQQRMVQERGVTTLAQLDFAALLRVLDQNWYELSSKLALPNEGRNWVKELQTVRNKWAHLSATAMPPSEIYRDADTLGRLLKLIGAAPAALTAVEAAKAAALRELTAQTQRQADPATESRAPVVTPESNTMMPTPAAAAETPPRHAALFNVGDMVALRSEPANEMPVIEVLSGAGEPRYRVFRNNARAVYYESQLQAVVAQAEERQILSAEELRAHLTALQLRSPSTAHLYSLRSGRITFVPYQYRPVLKLIRADRPRLLIADEVGVGKTIEAGLIIKELRARMDLASVLIICPKPLVAERKWFVEMKRFDEHFAALDGPLLRHCVRETHLDGEWPEQYAKAILPFSLFDGDMLYGRTGRGRSQEHGLLNLDPPPKFDLVIVDEAHHIRNTETYVHQGVRYFCDNAQAVLFLTRDAGPVGQPGPLRAPERLAARPGDRPGQLRPDGRAESSHQRGRAALPPRRSRGGQAMPRLVSAGRRTPSGAGCSSGKRPVSSKSTIGCSDAPLDDADRVGLVRAIEEFYTFSPLINRTRRRDIGEFTTRKPET